MGIPLYRIKDIRVLYGQDPWGGDMIDFDCGRLQPPGSRDCCQDHQWKSGRGLQAQLRNSAGAELPQQ